MAEDDAPTREPRDAIMQRVRVGLTGLAAVFLLTLLAASILGMLGQDDPHATRLANGTVVANAAETPKEPLAELGVAPGANVPRPAPLAIAPPARPPAPAPTLTFTPVPVPVPAPGSTPASAPQQPANGATTHH